MRRALDPSFHDAYGVGQHRAAFRDKGKGKGKDKGAGAEPPLWQRLANDMARNADGRPHDLFKGPLRRLRGGWVRHGKVAPARRAQL